MKHFSFYESIREYTVINVHECSCKVSVILDIFQSNLIFLDIFLFFILKSTNDSRVVPCGQTDTDDEADSRFSKFCERA
jgi:hypothetical protein